MHAAEGSESEKLGERKYEAYSATALMPEPLPVTRTKILHRCCRQERGNYGRNTAKLSSPRLLAPTAPQVMFHARNTNVYGPILH
jgi:hypothetical protein